MAGINRTISMLSRVHITAGKPLMTADGSCGFSNEKLVKRKKGGVDQRQIKRECKMNVHSPGEARNIV